MCVCDFHWKDLCSAVAESDTVLLWVEYADSIKCRSGRREEKHHLQLLLRLTDIVSLVVLKSPRLLLLGYFNIQAEVAAARFLEMSMGLS